MVIASLSNTNDRCITVQIGERGKFTDVQIGEHGKQRVNKQTKHREKKKSPVSLGGEWELCAAWGWEAHLSQVVKEEVYLSRLGCHQTGFYHPVMKDTQQNCMQKELHSTPSN